MPRFFYFILERSQKDKKDFDEKYTYPEGYKLDKKNDDLIIELEDDAITKDDIVKERENLLAQCLWLPQINNLPRLGREEVVPIIYLPQKNEDRTAKTEEQIKAEQEEIQNVINANIRNQTAREDNEKVLKKNPYYYTQLKVALESERQNKSLENVSPVIIGESILAKKLESKDCVCKEYNLPFGRKISCSARKKVVEICAELWGESRKIEMARELMICMAMETGRTFSPAEGHPYATGLIQFTGGKYGAITEMNKPHHNGKYNGGKTFTKEDLKVMTVEQQLDYVKYYFQMNMKEFGKKINTCLDMYMCIFCPNAVNEGNNYICYKKGTNNYSSNSSIDGERWDDINKVMKKDGKVKDYIEKGDLIHRYNENKYLGELVYNMKIARCYLKKREVLEDGYVSKYLTYAQVIYSETAKKGGIDNTPTKEHLENISNFGYDIYDLIYEKFEGKVMLTSVYRTKETNHAIKGSTTSQHLLGEAIDIVGISPITSKDIFDYVSENLEFNQLIWEFGTTQEPRWIHIGYSATKQNQNKRLRAIQSNGTTDYINFDL